MTLTSLAGAVPEARPSAITHEPVPSLPTRSVVLAGAAVTMLSRYLATGKLDVSYVLRLSDLPDVLAPSVDEKIPDAAHITVVEHGRPELCGEHQTRPVVRQTAQIKVSFKVQDLIFSACSKGGPMAVY